ncbi:YnbE family lipoprotein [Novosphingobium album (ex Liu et al. 2023)]
MTVAGMGYGQPGRRGLPQGAGRAAAVLVTGAMMLSGCISVNAPDKPIVIELNINIKQEVIYRLADDASKTIESHGDIF